MYGRKASNSYPRYVNVESLVEAGEGFACDTKRTFQSEKSLKLPHNKGAESFAFRLDVGQK